MKTKTNLSIRHERHLPPPRRYNLHHPIPPPLLLNLPHIPHRIPKLLLRRLKHRTILQPKRSRLHTHTLSRIPRTVHIPRRLRPNLREVELRVDQYRCHTDRRPVHVHHRVLERPSLLIGRHPPIVTHQRIRMRMALQRRQRLRLTLPRCSPRLSRSASTTTRTMGHTRCGGRSRSRSRSGRGGGVRGTVHGGRVCGPLLFREILSVVRPRDRERTLYGDAQTRRKRRHGLSRPRLCCRGAAVIETSSNSQREFFVRVRPRGGGTRGRSRMVVIGASMGGRRRCLDGSGRAGAWGGR